MPVANPNVRPAVVLHIENPAAPSQILRVLAEPSLKRRVFKIRAAEVVIERRRVTGEIGFHQIEIAVEVVIRSGNSHARLRLAVGAQRATGF